jgi:thiamine pyrophosphate-dependent acetolactate synthase large subunit-like protein
MKTSNASEVLVERLLEWEVDTIFRLPGSGIGGVSRRYEKDKARFTHVRHEEAAAFMALCLTRSLRVDCEFASPSPVLAVFIF